MQIKSVLVALGFAAIANAAAIEQRQTVMGFKIRRYTKVSETESGGNHQYIKVSDCGQLYFTGVAAADGHLFYATPAGELQAKTGSFYNSIAKNLQSYDVTLNPIIFRTTTQGESVKVSVGLGPINEITFNTQRLINGNVTPISGWNGITSVGGNVYCGKKADIDPAPSYQTIWLRAVDFQSVNQG